MLPRWMRRGPVMRSWCLSLSLSLSRCRGGSMCLGSLRFRRFRRWSMRLLPLWRMLSWRGSLPLRLWNRNCLRLNLLRLRLSHRRVPLNLMSRWVCRPAMRSRSLGSSLRSRSRCWGGSMCLGSLRFRRFRRWSMRLLPLWRMLSWRGSLPLRLWNRNCLRLNLLRLRLSHRRVPLNLMSRWVCRPAMRSRSLGSSLRSRSRCWGGSMCLGSLRFRRFRRRSRRLPPRSRMLSRRGSLPLRLWNRNRLIQNLLRLRLSHRRIPPNLMRSKCARQRSLTLLRGLGSPPRLPALSP